MNPATPRVAATPGRASVDGMVGGGPPERWTRASDDIDAQAALLPRWPQAYVQLERGRLASRVDGAALPGDFGVFRKVTDRKLQKTFGTPDDTVALALLTAGSDRIVFQGREAVAGDALLLPPGHAFDIVCRGRFDVLVATLPSARVAALVDAGPGGARALRPEVVRSGGAPGGLCAPMAVLLDGRGEGAFGAVGGLSLPNLLADLEERLAEHVAAQPADRPRRAAAPPLADAAFERARAILADEATGVGETPRLADLAGRLGVSVRLLHQVFRERMGVPPRLYAQSLRLSRARADLRAARAGEVTVAEIAVKWGFWHLGRFASTYRATFGELPSQSLQA